MSIFPFVLALFVSSSADGLRFPRQVQNDAVDLFFNQRFEYLDETAHNFKKRNIDDEDDFEIVEQANEIGNDGKDDEDGNDNEGNRDENDAIEEDDEDDENHDVENGGSKNNEDDNDSEDDEDGNDNGGNCDENDAIKEDDEDDENHDVENGGSKNNEDDNDSEDDEDGNDNEGNRDENDAIEEDDEGDENHDVENGGSKNNEDDNDSEDDEDESDSDDDEDNSDSEEDKDCSESSGDGEWGSGSGDYGETYDTDTEESDEEIEEEEESGQVITYEVSENVCSEEYTAKCAATLESIQSIEDINKEFCKDRVENVACLRNMFEHCIDDVDEKEKALKFLNDIKVALDILCESNEEDEGSIMECLHDSEKFREGGTECGNHAAEELLKDYDLMREIKEENIKEEELQCLISELVTECLVELAKDLCGESAAKLLKISLSAENPNNEEGTIDMFCVDEMRKRRRK